MNLKSALRKVFTRLSPTYQVLIKSLVASAVTGTLGRIRFRESRSLEKLAVNGGVPFRNTRFRPWRAPTIWRFPSWTFGMRRRLRDVYLSGTEGLPQPLAKRFSAQWAEYCDCRYGLLLPHGTDAIRLGLAAAMDHNGLEYGGEIIVPNLSFIASANAALDRRFGVALVDVDDDTLLIDPARVREAIVPGKTRAIMAVHLFGHPANIAPLRVIADEYGLKLIEDAAQAHGAESNAGRVGSLGDVAAFSFQSFKNLASGEGGILTTNDPALFERAYLLHNVGRPPDGAERWGHNTLGWNCRANEYQAAVLLERFRTFEAKQAVRRKNFALLQEMLADVSCVQAAGVSADVKRHGVHALALRYVPESCDGLAIADFLKTVQAEGGPIGRGYANTLSQQPAIQKLAKSNPDYIRIMPTPVADRVVKEMLLIGQEIFLGNERDMQDIAQIFRKIEKHYTRGKKRISAARSASKVEEAPVSTAIQTKSHHAPIRCGVIGVGTMGRIHASIIAAHRDFSLAAVSDVSPTGAQFAKEMGCQWFGDAGALIRSKSVDLVVIASPHWEHARLAIDALEHGLDVICEKPLAPTVIQSDAIIAAAKKGKALCAVCHQNRFEPVYQQVKSILDSGELGPMLRCSMVETMWRPDAYYTDSSWRGTWKGEGGGVLVNQAPHLLDRYLWFFGMPKSVIGRCDTISHSIEVEDTASAILVHPDGHHGYVHVSTSEYPAVSKIVVSCDRGRVAVDNGVLRVTTLRNSIREMTRAGYDDKADYQGETRELSAGSVGSLDQMLRSFYSNFSAARAGTEKLLCPVEVGGNVVDLANAIMLSSALGGKAVDTPIERSEYERFINVRLAKGKVV